MDGWMNRLFDCELIRLLLLRCPYSLLQEGTHCSEFLLTLLLVAVIYECWQEGVMTMVVRSYSKYRNRTSVEDNCVLLGVGDATQI